MPGGVPGQSRGALLMEKLVIEQQLTKAAGFTFPGMSAFPRETDWKSGIPFQNPKDGISSGGLSG